MKKLLLIAVVLLAGCTKIDVTPTINLGVEAKSTAITKVNPIISNGSNVTIEMDLTEGSKYSLQVTDLLDNKIKTFGFTADKNIYTRALDLSDLKNGDYNIILIDISGKESKANVIIKK
jgi:hypothetical protein